MGYIKKPLKAWKNMGKTKDTKDTPPPSAKIKRAVNRLTYSLHAYA